MESEYKEEETSIWRCLANLSSTSLVTVPRIQGELCSAAFETQWGSSPSQQWGQIIPGVWQEGSGVKTVGFKLPSFPCSFLCWKSSTVTFALERVHTTYKFRFFSQMLLIEKVLVELVLLDVPQSVWIHSTNKMCWEVQEASYTWFLMYVK